MNAQEFDLQVKETVEWAFQPKRRCEICGAYGTDREPVEYIPAQGSEDGHVDVPGGYVHYECYETKLGRHE